MPESSSTISLAVLGESISGFDSVFRDIIKLSKIDGDIKIEATSIKQSSVLVDVCISFLSAAPFEHADDFINFLKVASPGHYLQQAYDGYLTLENFAANRPLALLLIGYFVRRVILATSKGIKTGDQEALEELPTMYIRQARSLVFSKRYSSAMRPLIENSVTEIQINAKGGELEKVSINELNLPNFLADTEEILPQYLNGESYHIVGEISGLSSTQREQLTIQVEQDGSRIGLTAYPEAGKQTDDYKDYYKRRVIVLAEVRRNSPYQKPKLHLKSIALQQESML